MIIIIAFFVNNKTSHTRCSHRLSDDQIIDLTMTEALKALKSGKLTSKLYVKVLFDRIFLLDPEGSEEGLNAMNFYNNDGAIKRAKELDALRRKGYIIGPLHGIPILIKDSINVAGMPCTSSTPSLRTNIPSRNAEVVQSLVEAGAIILGKTNLAELSLAYSTTNDTFAGICKNPINQDFIPGGSSGGSAAGVSAKFAPVALLEDTVGSVRCPSMCCGIYGLRPTTKRYSQQGVIPLGSGFDTIGPGARTVKDLILLDSVITGDLESHKFRPRDLRIGIPRRFYYENLEPDVEKAMNTSLQKLKEAGVTLVKINVPSDLSTSSDEISVILSEEFVPDFTAYLTPEISDPNNPLGPITVQEVVEQAQTPSMKRAATSLLTPATPSDISNAKVKQAAQKSAFASYFSENNLDAIFVPSASTTALPIALGSDALRPIYRPRYGVASFNGLPSLAMPIGLSSEGLPIGAEVCGPVNSDRKVLFISKLFENIFDLDDFI